MARKILLLLSVHKEISLTMYLITPTLPSLKESWRTFILASCLSAFETDIRRSDSTFSLCIDGTKEINQKKKNPRDKGTSFKEEKYKNNQSVI